MSSHADVDRLRHCRKAGSRKSRNVKTRVRLRKAAACGLGEVEAAGGAAANVQAGRKAVHDRRSEEHTSELQSLMRISYAVFCLKNKKDKSPQSKHTIREYK